MKENVDITGMTWQEVVALVNCSKTIAQNALKRGYYVVNYKKRTCVPGPIDAEGCCKMAWFTSERFFRHHCPWNIAPEDCVQEAVLRLAELGGHARAGERRFQFYACKHAMQAYITKYGRSNDLGDWRTNRQQYNDKRNAEQRASGSSSPDPWRRSKQATAKIVRAIYELGEGVNQAQLRRLLDISSGGVSKRVSIAVKEGLVENGGGITGCKGHALRITGRGRAFIGAMQEAA